MTGAVQTRAARRTARGLALACHPVPSLAVTLLTAGLIALASVPLGRGVVAALAMLATQLSIGWSNDARDAVRDTAIARSDKPVALGAVAARTVWTAAIMAVVVALALAASLNPTELGLIALGIACGWAYNLWLKATPLSWLPYAIAFSLLPTIATHALPVGRWPAVWAPVAGGVFGVAAHFTNVLPDVIDDEAQGIRGLPHRLGARVSAVVGPVLLAAASGVILFGGGGGSAVVHVIGFGLALCASAWAAVSGAREPGSRRYFLAVIAVVALDLVFFAAAGSSLR